MAMECPECGAESIVAYRREYRHEQGEPLTEVRAYVCKNPIEPHAFLYRNSYLRRADRLDAARFMRQYERQRERSLTGQEEMDFEDEGPRIDADEHG